MRKGKISETVLKRSVLKFLKNNREEVLRGPETGTDGAVMDPGNGLLVITTSTVSGNIRDKAWYGINRAVNNLAAMNAEPVGLTVTILAGENFEEKDLQKLTARIQEICDEFHMTVLGGHTEITDDVNDLIMTFTAMGRRKKSGEAAVISENAAVIITGYIGLEGTAILAELKEKELSGYYYHDLVRQAKSFKNRISVQKAAEALFGKNAMLHDLSQGGFLSALWDIGIRTGKGMTIDMKAVPIRQETVEVCEFLSLNPYELISGGAMMVITDDEEGVGCALEKNGIPFSVIGYLNSGNDRILKFGETTSFLNRPSADEIFKII